MLIRRTAPVAAVLIAEAGGLVLLHRLGSAAVEWGDFGRWLAERPPEDVLVALVRVAALALAWWLAASTILYALARAIRVPSLLSVVEWATLPAVRRLVDGLAATTIAAGSVLGTSGAAAAAPVDDTAVVVQLGGEGTSVTTAPRYRPRPAGSGDAVGSGPAPTAAAGPTAVPIQTSTPFAVVAEGDRPLRASEPDRSSENLASYVVQPGDNLWRIAERHVAMFTGRSEEDLTAAEVARYWVRLVDDVRGHLRSGDPDLIYPGEELTLPAITLNPTR